MDESRIVDAAAWAEVEAQWQDDEAHRVFLARCGDLEALAEAGRRYRAALDLRPGDAVALRWRDEIVKRATAMALAQLPRTKPPRPMSPGLRTVIIAAAVLALVSALSWLFFHFPRPGADR